MSGTASPIMMKIGTRKRCGDSPGVGSISNVTTTDVTGTNAGAYSPTIWGQSGHQVSNVTFNNVNLTLPGGHGSVSDGVPSDNGDYNPNSIGTRPAYGWYIHQANGIHFTSSSVKFSTTTPGRRSSPTPRATSARRLHRAEGQRSPYDLGFQSVTGYCVTSPGNTPRINASGSSKSC